MASCDVTEWITNAGAYAESAVGGQKSQKALLAYALDGFSGLAVTDRTTAINAMVALLGPVPMSQIRAGLISITLAAAARGGTNLGTNVNTIRASNSSPELYFETLPEQTLDKLIAYLLCKVFATLVP